MNEPINLRLFYMETFKKPNKISSIFIMVITPTLKLNMTIINEMFKLNGNSKAYKNLKDTLNDEGLEMLKILKKKQYDENYIKNNVKRRDIREQETERKDYLNYIESEFKKQFPNDEDNDAEVKNYDRMRQKILIVEYKRIELENDRRFLNGEISDEEKDFENHGETSDSEEEEELLRYRR